MPRTQPLDFANEVGQRFDFLVHAYAMQGPQYSELLLPAVTYRNPVLTISVHMNTDHHDGAGGRISVSVRLGDGHGSAGTDLPELVEAALFAPRHRVAWKAHSVPAAQATLDDNATWLRRLVPRLLDRDGPDLVRKASEQPMDQAGNPKRRPPNVKWIYG